MKRPDCTNGQRNATGLSVTQWAEFLNRHDPIWEILPDCYYMASRRIPPKTSR